MTIIDELLKQKEIKLIEHAKAFHNDELTLEMFTTKYDGRYYSNENINSIEPFVSQTYLDRGDLWDTHHYDVRKFPKNDDPIYIEIENFPDYDYLNSLAYEMLIRSIEYKRLLSKFSDLSRDELRNKFDKLGIDINDVFDLKKISKHFALDKKKNTFSNSYFNMTINDIDKGVDRLIEFYIAKEQIYVIDSVNKILINVKNEKRKIEVITDRTFKTITNIKLENIKASLSNYYIPVKCDYKTSEHNDNLAVIDYAMPLVTLNYDFLLSIEELLPNRIKGSIEFNFTRPLLRFKELPIVDVPINLNLSREELTQLVIKLKDDFEDGSLKNPINLLYGSKYSFQEMKNIVPFKMTKKSIAEMFFVYDLYQDVHGAMLLHKQKLSKFKQMDKEEIEREIVIKRKKIENGDANRIESLKSTYKDNKALRRKIDENRRKLRVLKREIEKGRKEDIININKHYKEFTKDYNTITVLEDLVRGYNISPYTCKQYLKFMRKYIEKSGYKELIIGKKI